MEHQEQMNQKLSSKEFLLQNSLGDIEKPAIYSLEAEFAKTKRNRDPKPLLIVLGFVFLLAGITVGIASYLEHQSKQINIDITAFEDLRLKEALNEAKAVSSNLEAYQYALQMLLKDQNAAGCVLDPRQKDKMPVFVAREITEEVIVSLYRADRTYVGKIKLVPGENGVWAETIEVAAKQRIKPLDWFRLPN